MPNLQFEHESESERAARNLASAKAAMEREKEYDSPDGAKRSFSWFGCIVACLMVRGLVFTLLYLLTENGIPK